MESNIQAFSPSLPKYPETPCSGETISKENLIELLWRVQTDYSTAKKQLGELYQTFNQTETTVNRELHSIFEAAGAETPLDKQKMMIQNFGQPTMDNREVSTSLQDLAPRSAMSLRAYCLGKFEVYLGQERVDQWRGLKAKSLLKFLVAHRGKHIPKDVLMEALWPGYPPESASNNLKAAVYALRQTIGSVSVETGHNGKNFCSLLLSSERKYALNPEIELWVDAEEFHHHWLNAQSLEKKGKSMQAVSEYGMAENLYRGDYLEDDLYEDWTLLQREALKDIYLSVVAKLADEAFRAEDLQECIAYCQKILAKDSCREDTYRQLMRCYSRLGQRHRALRWYELCAQTLKRELDFAPDNQTAELYQKLLRQEYI